MLSPDVTANRNMAKNQCNSKAGAELCSSVRGESAALECDMCLRIHAYGVVVLWAKKRENGKIPSLAISCLTANMKRSSQHLSSGWSFEPLSHLCLR